MPSFVAATDYITTSPDFGTPDYRVADFPGNIPLSQKNRDREGPNAEILPPESPKVGGVEPRVDMSTNSDDEPPGHAVAGTGNLPNPGDIPRTMSFLRM